jgi:DTW domain-containing protein YfiP
MPGERLDLTEVVGPDAWVLGPGARPPADDAVIRTVIVLDGAWSQVRGMRSRTPPLASLPTLSLPSPEVAPMRMRRPMREGQLATIEAVAAALELRGEEDAGRGLREVFAVHAARVRALRGGKGP